MKLKIALLTREYPPDTLWGGLAVTYYNSACGLAKNGHEVHVICQSVSKPADYVSSEGVHVHRVGRYLKTKSAVSLVDYNFWAWLKLKDIIRKYGIQVVHVPYTKAEGFLYSIHKKTPLVIEMQSGPSDLIRTKTYSGFSGLLKLKILLYLSNLTIKKADKLLCESKFSNKHIVTEFSIKPQILEMVYPPIDTDKYKFTSSDIRFDLDLPSEDPLILFVGRLEQKKGVHILCKSIPEIVASVPNVKFIFVGQDTNTAPAGGSFKRYINSEAQVNGFAENIIFIDFLPPDQLAQLYSACDVFVLPSLEESFGLVLAEAMACGTPSVATATGIALELEEFKSSGLEIVPIGNVEGLQKALLRMLSVTKEERLLMGKTNRNLIQENFSISKRVDKLVGIYNSLI